MPPPPKNRLHNKTGKLKNLNRPESLSSSQSSTRPQLPTTTNNMQSSQSQSVNSNPSTSTAIEGHNAPINEADQQFELELCWCIQTLETSLATGKLNAKQAQDTDKTLKLLKSAKQPTIKKRQIMRAAFGDYRTKMKDEEKKLRLGKRQIKFADDKKATTKSCFVRKSVLATLGNGKEFKFNFPVDELRQLELDNKCVDNAADASTGRFENGKDTEEQNKIEKQIPFAPTDNSFRFNFDISELKSE